MTKPIRLIAAGIVPLILGFLLHWMILALPNTAVVTLPLSVVLLAAWGFAAFKLSDPAGSAALQAFLMCALGLVILLLLLYQELVVGAYWGGWIGLGTQLFFLPWLPLPAAAASFLASMIGPSAMPMWADYLAVWICLFAAGCIGCSARRRRQRRPAGRYA